jgi:hypothetical protein
MTACLGVEPPEDPLEHLEEMVVEVGKRAV